VLLPDDLQVDPREAGPALAAHLAQAGVTFYWRTSAWNAEPGILHTSRGEIRAEAIVIAVGADVDTLLPALAERYGLERCGLDMLLADGVGLPLPLLTGSSLLRYSAFATAPAAADVRARFAREDPGMLEFDVNQMYTERPDGTLVVGDTHRTGVSIPPFQAEPAAELLLRRGGELFGHPLRVRERWQGVYARGPQEFLIEAPGDGIRVVSVLTGIGMTTGLGLAESVIDELWG
jgi:FAD dependent oxidoreductase.